MTAVSALSPAKLNLGLEILGKRPDGFHEIRTVMACVALYDRLVITPSDRPSLFVNNPALNVPDNLTARAAAFFPDTPVAIELHKRIPEAAGLGGASGNAAATLMALAALRAEDATPESLAELGATLGSDVPFFFCGGTALVAGRGERIQPLRSIPSCWAVIVVPRLRIPSKTATLYRALAPADFSDGTRVATCAAAVLNGEPFTPEMLANAFARPLYAHEPSLASVPQTLLAAGASGAYVSGAGPAHYSLETDLYRAHDIARRMRSVVQGRAAVHVARLTASGVILFGGSRVRREWVSRSGGDP